jgi:plasmid stabilization system protein ParE
MILFAPEAVSDIERVRHFLDVRNPKAARRALRTIWTALELLQDIPELGRPTEDDGIRQIVIRFGGAGYIVRYTVLPDGNDILVLHLWHGREART